MKTDILETKENNYVLLKGGLFRIPAGVPLWALLIFFKINFLL